MDAVGDWIGVRVVYPNHAYTLPLDAHRVQLRSDGSASVERYGSTYEATWRQLEGLIRIDRVNQGGTLRLEWTPKSLVLHDYDEEHGMAFTERYVPAAKDLLPPD